MKDYYKELEIDKKLSTEEINKKLVELNVLWTKRSNINQEKAMPKLLLIYEAQNIFKAEDSRREYDKNLSEENEKKEEKQYETSCLKAESNHMTENESNNNVTEKKYYDNSKTPDNGEDGLTGCLASICLWALGLGFLIPILGAFGIKEGGLVPWIIGYTICAIFKL